MDVYVRAGLGEAVRVSTEEEKGGESVCGTRRARRGCLIQSQCETVDICAFFPLHYVTGAVLRWISYKSPMQHIQHATSSLTSLIMDEEIVIQE